MTADVVADVGRAASGPWAASSRSPRRCSSPAWCERHSPPSRSWFAVGSTRRGDARPRGRDRRAAAHSRRRRGRRRHPGGEVDEAGQQLHHAGARPRSLGLPMVEAAAMPGMRELMLRVRPGGARAGAALGHPVLPIFGLTRTTCAEPERRRRDAARHAVRRLRAARHDDHVLHDWMKGRHSEVDDLNGLVVAEQARLGGAAPVNAAVVELAHRDRARRGPARTRPTWHRCGTSPAFRRS